MRNSANGRVPLRLIAEKAGVSRMTVSLALRASPSISKETGSRVQEIAQQLGYRPDPVVSDLMASLRLATQTQHSVTIGFVSGQRGPCSWRERAIHEMYREGARGKASALGFRLEEFHLYRDGMSARRVLQIMRARGIEGALLLPDREADCDFATTEAFSDFCCVVIGASNGATALHHVGIDHFHAAMETCHQLTKLGYRCPGLVLSEEKDRRTAYRMRAGFVTSAHLAEDAGPWPALIRSHLDYAEFARWMHENQPDAIIHAMDPSTIAAWLRRYTAGRPAEIGQVCLELDPEHRSESGIVPNAKVVGAAALELLAARIAKHEPGQAATPTTVMVAGSWFHGNSTPARTYHPFSPAKSRMLSALLPDPVAPLPFETSLEHKPLRAS